MPTALTRYSIDGILTYPILCRYTTPWIRNDILKLSPNQITIINMIFRCFILYSLFSGCFWTTMMSVPMTHFLDCLDGYIARTYHLTTPLGHQLDAWSDRLFWLPAFVWILHKLIYTVPLIEGVVLLTLSFTIVCIKFIHEITEHSKIGHVTILNIRQIHSLIIDNTILIIWVFLWYSRYTWSSLVVP